MKAKAKNVAAIKDTSCAACGKPLDLFTTPTTSVEGSTVCAPGTGCLGGELARIRDREATGDEPPQLDEAAYFDEADER